MASSVSFNAFLMPLKTSAIVFSPLHNAKKIICFFTSDVLYVPSSIFAHSQRTRFTRTARPRHLTGVQIQRCTNTSKTEVMLTVHIDGESSAECTERSKVMVWSNGKSAGKMSRLVFSEF